MASKFKYTCFNSRALNEARLIFAYARVPFEEDLFIRDSWAEEKSNYPWGQLPVLEVNGEFLSQSKAIVRYLGKKYDLAGEDDFESAKCDEMIEAMADLQKVAFPPLHEQDPAKKEQLINTLQTETFPKYLSEWDKMLKQNGKFLVGKKMSYADISIASYLQVLNDLFGGELLDKYDALKSHNAMVFDAPGIKEWVDGRPKTQY
jgi:glutathione S-transferase